MMKERFQIKGLDMNCWITKESFIPILESNETKKIAYVDGGSNLIYDKTTEINALIYAGFIIFDNKLISLCVKRFNVMFRLIETHKSKLVYEVDYEELDDLAYNSNVNLRFSFPKSFEIDYVSDTSKLISNFRRLFELQIVKALNEFFVVLDGSLEYRTNEELQLIKSFKNVIALSKKTRLITETKHSIEDYFNEFCKINNITAPWFVKLGEIRNDVNFDVYAIKFTDLMPYVFRMDVINVNDFNKMLSVIYSHSKDGLVYGYPYGLVLVDHFARVSNDEARFRQVLLEIKENKQIYDLHNEFNSFY